MDGGPPALPGGNLRLERRGSDKVRIGDRTLDLVRYSVAGLIWGRESLWLDADGGLAAMVGVDAEVDHFEAVRDDCEDAPAAILAPSGRRGKAGPARLTRRTGPPPNGATPPVHA